MEISYLPRPKLFDTNGKEIEVPAHHCVVFGNSGMEFVKIDNYNCEIVNIKNEEIK